MFVTFSVFCHLQPVSVQAETHFCGIIDQGIDWTLAGSPYIVTGDIYITNGGRLSIESGVEVLFDKPIPCQDEVVQLNWADSQWVSIKVDGSFFVKGIPTKPVRFAPHKKPFSGPGWDGIYLRNKSRALARVDGGYFIGAHKAIFAQHSEIVVTHSIFESNNIGLYLDNGSHVHAYNNVYAKNQSAGIYVVGSNPIIENSLFYKQTGFGIWADSRLGVTVRYNAFYKNLDGHCYHCPAGTLKMNNKTERGDSTDAHQNMIADPILVGTDSYTKARTKDIKLPTPLAQVSDSQMAEKHEKFKKKIGATPDTLHPFGIEPWRISKYSPLRNEGNPAKEFADRDSSRNDIGLFGGKWD